MPREAALRERAPERRAEAEALSPAQLRRAFDLQTVQRKLKDAGRFVFIERVKGNPSFLRHIPSSVRYVRQALDRLPQAWLGFVELCPGVR